MMPLVPEQTKFLVADFCGGGTIAADAKEGATGVASSAYQSNGMATAKDGNHNP